MLKSVMCISVSMIGYEVPHLWQVSQSSYGEAESLRRAYCQIKTYFFLCKSWSSHWLPVKPCITQNNVLKSSWLMRRHLTQFIRMCHRIPVKLFVNDEASRRILCRLPCPPKTVCVKGTNSMILQGDIGYFDLLKYCIPQRVITAWTYW